VKKDLYGKPLSSGARSTYRAKREVRYMYMVRYAMVESEEDIHTFYLVVMSEVVGEFIVSRDARAGLLQGGSDTT